MSRNLTLAIGALLWALVAGDAIVHVITGAWTTTAIMAVVGIAWVVLRRARWSPLRAAQDRSAAGRIRPTVSSR